MMDIFQIMIEADDSDLVAKEEKHKAAINAQEADWKAKRAVIMSQMRDVQMSINIMIRSVRMAFNLVGVAMDPVESALLSMISSTASTMLAVSIGMSATGILAGAAMYLAAAAYGMQIGQTAALIQKFDYIEGKFQQVSAAFDSLEALEFTGKSF